ncbi:MAG: FIST C-terminal domain-containing protein [Candidatus Eisenbacteria sp.]|nr:FIST C-terminal domain-containing protein [Candidatus Eisenbacteria bacterium]
MLKTHTTTAGVGTSTAVDSLEAGTRAAEQAVADLGDAPCDFVIVYGGMGYDHPQLLRGVRSVTGDAPLAGCSTQGVVARSWARESPRVVGVMAVASGDMTFTHSLREGLGHDSYEVGCRISDDLLVSPADEPVVLLCLYDPLTGVNVDQLLRGLESTRPIPIIGGAASQPWGKMVATRQYFDGEVARDAATCILISGRAAVEFGVTLGAVPLGMEATITRAEGNIIHEIDGQSAYSVWKEHVGAGDDLRAEDHASWAIGIRLPESVGGEYAGCVTRTLFKIDREQGSIYLQSEIPEGTRVILHHRTFEAVMNLAQATARRVGKSIGDRQPCFALSFECGARGTPFLGAQAARDEVVQIQKEIGHDVPWLGMYAWGEIAPMGSVNYFHNYTLPICVIMPDEQAATR